MTGDTFFSRWSRRKSASQALPVEAKARAKPAEPPGAPSEAAAVAKPARLPPEALPPVESLTPQSDFAPFMHADVDEGLKRQALKTLFQDPQFNVMDGLDVYIDDYSKPDPLPEGWLERLNQVARLGDFQEAPAPAAAQASPIEAPQALEKPPEGQFPTEGPRERAAEELKPGALHPASRES
ncbi:MAG TPA: DUF3306 domain-containing protein [Usitatibacter sp.]|nr:DUF3306 domain-containing protein [Usitatibacter sp.]